MKRTILMAVSALMMCVSTASAQSVDAGAFSVKPYAGVSLSYFSPKPSYVNDMKTGYAFGVEGIYQASDELALSLGVGYARMGVKEKNVTYMFGTEGMVKFTDLRQNLDYIYVPVMASYYVTENLALKAGVQFGFNTYKGATYDAIVGETGVGAKTYRGEDSVLDVNKFDFGIPVGVAFEYENLCLDLRYYFGLNKVFKSTELTKSWEEDKVKNRAVMFTVGYKFDFE